MTYWQDNLWISLNILNSIRYIDAKELKTTFSEIGMKISDKDVREMMKEAGVQVSHQAYIMWFPIFYIIKLKEISPGYFGRIKQK